MRHKPKEPQPAYRQFLGVGILVALVLPALNITINNQHKLDVDFFRITLNGLVSFVFLLICWIINAHLFQFDRQHNKRIVTFIIIFCNTLVLILFLFSTILIIRGLPSVLQVMNISYWMIALKALVSVLLIYIIQYALFANKKAQEIILLNEKLKTENLRSQLAILQQQINPHFLFNSLSTLRALIRLGDDNSEEFVLKLSEIYRQLLAKRDKGVVSLREEIEFVDDYLFMLQARFGKKLIVSSHIPIKMYELRLPTFSLQLLIENCVKHNTLTAEKPLEIRLFSTSPTTLTIENNRHPKLGNEDHSGYGLRNLQQRYELMNLTDGVDVFADDNVFRVKIKLI